MADTTQLLFNQTGPGVCEAVGETYIFKTPDGVDLAITHEISFFVEDTANHTVDQCFRRFRDVVNSFGAWPAAGIRWRRVMLAEEAMVRVGFYADMVGRHSTRLWSTGKAEIFLAETLAFERHEGLLHETEHTCHAYHMGDAWPDYPYVGVMRGDGMDTDRWLTMHDKRGLRNYKQGKGLLQP